MVGLNISKVAVGCSSIDALRERQRPRAVNGVVPVYTRFRPKRADELIGGSLYWIVKHRIAARQTILGFDADPTEGKTVIRLDAELVPVRAKPRRAHQGWRYLDAADAPPDFGDGGDAGDALATLPPALINQLMLLALL